MNLSASISFFAILSVLPMSMIFISILGHVMGSDGIVGEITRIFAEEIPGAKDILLSNISSLVKSENALGWWGIVSLVLISTILFGSLETALDRIFTSGRKRNFLYSRLLAVFLILVILVFLFLPSVVHFLELFLVKFGYSIPLSAYLSGKTFFVVFAMLSFIAAVMIIPNHKVSFKHAVFGGLIYAVGVAVAKFFFRWYMAMTFSRYNLIYGSLTALVLMVLWVYYLVNILLISAEVVAYLQKRRSA